MQKDFHYCCIKCLAQSAGFDKNDAQIIAYASQFVDDATAHEGIRIQGVPEVAKNLVKNNQFEPVCTAHKGIQYLTGIDRDVQKKVYIPFHFMPGIPYTGTGVYDYRVRPDSPLIMSVVNSAVDFYKNAGTKTKLQGLIKIGISLHTYADTWSHQRFSGRWSAADNDIERIRVFRNNEWEPLGFIDQIKHNIIPSIGHAEAINFPDQSHMSWRYEHDRSGKDITRHNTEICLDAAEAIYGVLCDTNTSQPNWKKYVGDVQACLEMPTDSIKAKFGKWKKKFPEIAFEYDPLQWRFEALDGEHHDWEHFNCKEDFATLNYKAKGDDKWFLFHFVFVSDFKRVIEQIRGDLL